MHIEEAFKILFGDKIRDGVDIEDFQKVMTSEGEPLSTAELGPLLEKLSGISDKITAENFSKEVLNFEEVEEDEDDEGEI